MSGQTMPGGGLSAREQELFAHIGKRRQELFGLLKDLIAVDTVNYISHGNEAACAPMILDWYRDLGLACDLYYPDDIARNHPAWLPGRGTDRRPNVAGVSRGSTGERRVMLAAHTDTMPVGDRADWQRDPFGGEIIGDRLYGRGSGDNKFGIATGVFLLRVFRDLGLHPRADIVLSAYCDEEYGGGNGSIASCLKYPCDMYINFDGGNSSRELWTCAVGGQVLDCVLTARQPQDSASLVIGGLNRVLKQVEGFGQRRREELGAHELYRGSDMERSALRVMRFQCGDGGTNQSRGVLEFVYYTVSDKSLMDAEVAAMEQALRPQLSELGIDFSGFRPRCRYFDYARADENDPAIRLLMDCAGLAEGREIRAAGSCLSDYFLYHRYGSPCSVSYGILRDFALEGGAHQPDEYISCTDFVRHAQAVALFLLRY